MDKVSTHKHLLAFLHLLQRIVGNWNRKDFVCISFSEVYVGLLLALRGSLVPFVYRLQLFLHFNNVSSLKISFLTIISVHKVYYVFKIIYVYIINGYIRVALCLSF